jgi:phosphoribosylanthranilate isomerase
MHLCGGALTGFVEGRQDIFDLMAGFHRIQLNLEFGAVEGTYDPERLLARIQAHQEFDFIIQYTDKRHEMLPALAKLPNHAILFDASAGRGVAPDGWPAPLPGHFCGYAGGINPGNVAGHIEKIRAAGAVDTWIDMESGVRTDDRFDLDKVRAVLNIAKPFV